MTLKIYPVGTSIYSFKPTNYPLSEDHSTKMVQGKEDDPNSFLKLVNFSFSLYTTEGSHLMMGTHSVLAYVILSLYRKQEEKSVISISCAHIHETETNCNTQQL